MKKFTILLYLTFLSFHTYPQDVKETFFREQLASYNEWLNTIRLTENLRINTSSQVFDNDTLIINLSSNYKKINSLSDAWRILDNILVIQRQTSVAELIHQQAAFLFDLAPEQVKIYINVGDNQERFTEIYYSNSIQEKRNAAMSPQPITIPFTELKLAKNYKKIHLKKKQLVQAVTNSLSIQLSQYYKKKPSSFFYSINIDTSKTYYNSFTYKITCIKNEIIQDDFLEFIELTADVSQQDNNTVEIRLIVKGKYCSGLLCPGQHERKYYSMDDKYVEHVKAYTNFMEKNFEKWLSN